jgi:hypothetical protein
MLTHIKRIDLGPGAENIALPLTSTWHSTHLHRFKREHVSLRCGRGV